MRNLFLLPLFLLLAGLAPAQQGWQGRCGTSPGDMSQQVPFAQPRTDSLGSIVIPVVFHVVHDGKASNVSNKTIRHALARMNSYFMGKNPDTLLIPEVFRKIRGVPRFEFRLARLDMDGNCREGVIRYNSPKTSSLGNIADISDGLLWDVSRYLNIFISKDLISALPQDAFLLDGMAKLALLSGTGNPDDFMHLRYDVLGDTLNGRFRHDKGSNLQHEMGHMLGLDHIWHTPGCNGDDGVDDTPLQDEANYSWPEYPHISCNNGPDGDNFHNLMDYTNVRNMFTQGQVERMIACLEGNLWRSNQVTTENLDLTGTSDSLYKEACHLPPVADMGYGNYLGRVRANEFVEFHDASWNRPLLWHWIFPGAMPASSIEENPTVVFPAPGIYPVKLFVSNPFGTDSMETQVYVEPESYILPVNAVESFEDEALNDGIGRFRIAGTNWRVVDTVAYTGQRSIHLPTDPLYVSAFITHAFDLGDIPNHGRKLEFKLALARTNQGAAMSTNTGLRVIIKFPIANEYADLVANNVGWNTASVPLHTQVVIPASTLVTEVIAPKAPFHPTVWKTISLDIPDVFTGPAEFAIEWGAFEPNNQFRGLFIDDIRVTNVITAAGDSPLGGGMKIYPNPSPGNAMVVIQTEIADGAEILVTDLWGRDIRREVPGPLEGGFGVRMGDLPSGMYLVSLMRQGQVLQREKLLICR